MNNFQTSKVLAKLCQYIGSAAAILCGLALVFTLTTGNDEPFSRAQNISLYAGGAFGGLILVLIGQLVEAQLTIAINSTSILKLLQAQQANPQTSTATSYPTSQPIRKTPEPQIQSTASPQQGGKFLRTYKGAALHKHADGISVNGEGRFPNILAAEKQAKRLAENQS